MDPMLKLASALSDGPETPISQMSVSQLDELGADVHSFVDQTAAAELWEEKTAMAVKMGIEMAYTKTAQDEESSSKAKNIAKAVGATVGAGAVGAGATAGAKKLKDHVALSHFDAVAKQMPSQTDWMDTLKSLRKQQLGSTSKSTALKGGAAAAALTASAIGAHHLHKKHQARKAEKAQQATFEGLEKLSIAPVGGLMAAGKAMLPGIRSGAAKGAIGGAVLGGVRGAVKNPGVDPYTGQQKSRLGAMAKGALGGAALGGAAGGAAAGVHGAATAGHLGQGMQTAANWTSTQMGKAKGWAQGLGKPAAAPAAPQRAPITPEQRARLQQFQGRYKPTNEVEYGTMRQQAAARQTQAAAPAQAAQQQAAIRANAAQQQANAQNSTIGGSLSRRKDNFFAKMQGGSGAAQMIPGTAVNHTPTNAERIAQFRAQQQKTIQASVDFSKLASDYRKRVR